MLDTNKIKSDFPIYKHRPNLTYLDSTATSLKPKQVLSKLNEYYENYSANIYRGVYHLSEKATAEYEKTREIVAKFIGAHRSEEIIFTRNTTESINLVAYALGRKLIDKDSEIVTSVMEHHSNFVPWQQLAIENGATFKVIDVTDDGYLDLNLKNLSGVVTKKTKILALTYVSNVLGTINSIKEIIAAAKKINPQIITVIDAAQAVPYMKVDVADLGCDFLAFSSHKMLGPTGVGVLWGKYSLLKDMYPFNFGGEMINEVYIDRTTFKNPPQKFEAGTPAIAEVIALKEAVSYLQKVGLNNIRSHEYELTNYALTGLKEEFGKDLRIYGPGDANDKGGIIAFTYKNYHPHDIAQILDEDNICIRAGHHCAMPLHTRFKIQASARMSFGIYNDSNDVDKLIKGLHKVNKILK